MGPRGRCGTAGEASSFSTSLHTYLKMKPWYRFYVESSKEEEPA